MSMGIGGGGGIGGRISVSCLSGKSLSMGWHISKIPCPREMSVLSEKLFASFLLLTAGGALSWALLSSLLLTR